MLFYYSELNLKTAITTQQLFLDIFFKTAERKLASLISPNDIITVFLFHTMIISTESYINGFL